MTIEEEKMFKKLYVASKSLVNELHTNRRIKKYNVVNIKDGFSLMVAISLLETAIYEIEHNLIKGAK
jgi:hypothetical protein